MRNAIPGGQAPPPYARFEQDQGVQNIFTNAGQVAARDDDAARRRRQRQNDALRLFSNAIANANTNAPRPQGQASGDREPDCGQSAPSIRPL